MIKQSYEQQLDTDIFHLSLLVSKPDTMLIGSSLSISGERPEIVGGLGDLIFGDVSSSQSKDPLTQFYQGELTVS